MGLKNSGDRNMGFREHLGYGVWSRGALGCLGHRVKCSGASLESCKTPPGLAQKSGWYSIWP